MALGRSTQILLSSLLLAALPAAAEPQIPPVGHLGGGRTFEVLMDLDDPAVRSDWLGLQLQNVNVSGKYGLIYSRQFQLGERGLEFRFRGPALGRQRRLGLSFETRF